MACHGAEEAALVGARNSSLLPVGVAPVDLVLAQAEPSAGLQGDQHQGLGATRPQRMRGSTMVVW